MKESLARRRRRKRRRKKEKHFGCLATFWFGTFVMLFHATGHVVGHKNTELYVVIKAYKLTVLRDIFILSHIACPCYIPSYRVYQLYDNFIYLPLSDLHLCFLQHIKVNIAIRKVAKVDVRIGKTTSIIICLVDRWWYKGDTSPEMGSETTFRGTPPKQIHGMISQASGNS